MPYWETVGRSGVVAIGAALLHTGQLVFFARPEDPPHAFGPSDSGLAGDEFLSPCDRPATLSTTMPISGPDAYLPIEAEMTHNPFCAGLTHLPDGRLLVAGGDKKDDRQELLPVGTRDGRRSLRVFVPRPLGDAGPGEWRDIGRISGNRWYPTCALLPDGRIFIVSGYLDDAQAFNNQNATGELIPPAAGGAQYLPPLAEAWPFDSFPFVQALPSGSVFLFAKDTAYFLELDADSRSGERWRIDSKTVKLPPRTDAEGGKSDEPAKLYPSTASAVLLPLRPDDYGKAEMMIFGGGGFDVYPHWNTLPGSPQPTFRSRASKSFFRMQVDPPAQRTAWTRGEMPHERVMPDAVLLADGTVLVVNGNSHGYAGGAAGTGPARPLDYGTNEWFAVLTPDLYDPVSEKWETLEPAERPRLYHSTALLLPDARVLVAGSDHQVNSGDNNSQGRKHLEYMAQTFEYRLEVFTPPYLRGADVLRPVIEPSQNHYSIPYDAPFEITVTNLDCLTVGPLRATLLKLGASTHSNNMGQRCVELRVLDPVPESKPKTVHLQAPPDSRVAPPGYYMLFVLHKGVPSEACFVRLPLLPADATDVVRRPELTLWLRADTGVVADAEGVTTSWADLSGHGNDVYWQPDDENPTARRCPHWLRQEINGHPVLRFSLFNEWEGGGTVVYGSSLRTVSDAFLPDTGDYTVFAVMQAWPQGSPQLGKSGAGEGGWGDLLGWGDFTGAAQSCVGLRLGSGVRLYRATDDQLPRYPGTASLVHYHNPASQFAEGNQVPRLSLSSPALLEVVRRGDRTELSINGQIAAQTKDPVSGNTGRGPLFIGQNGSDGAFFRGDIAEIIIYEDALGADERAALREYLCTKYKLDDISGPQQPGHS